MGVVHRDIKLENLVYKDETTLVIADFGLAAQLQPGFEFKKYGTPGYIAPEVLNLKVYTEKIDIFSVGVVCYILYCFELLFKANTNTGLLRTNVERDPEPEHSGECGFREH